MLRAFFNTLSFVLSSTFERLFKALETVIADTPSASAICFNVTSEFNVLCLKG